LLDLGEVAAWGMDDPTFLRLHKELTPRGAARLAFVAYARALQRRPTSSTALAGLADLFRKIRDLDAREGKGGSGAVSIPRREDRLVEAAYRKAIEMEPANYFYYGYLADFLKAREPEKAMPLYEQAIQLMPDLSWHYYLGSTGQIPPDLFEAARRGLTKALEGSSALPPERIESNLGYLYERQRDYEAALEHYRKAIELAADPSPYLYQAAVALGFLRRHDEALEYFKRALARETLGAKTEAAALSQIGRILLGRGDSKGAVESLARARALEPGSYATRMDLGTAYSKLGENEKAAEEFRQALGIDPTRPEPYKLLIELYRGSHDFALAIPLARRLTEMFPDNTAYREQLDALYLRMELR
ncbi:MAG TPA: tetratricopeptide repeat protein, partial [Candidatus Polarisedimenticolia bacterium]|nr:tetratricopeptide repeat protein [Candidatus Polarisedimenticolia bacterium]